MNKLLEHPGFRLIYVDNNESMSLILPLEHKEDIIEKGYRCISHLWGNATKWPDHPVKNVMWGVDLREEKRTKLLQIFNHFKGYWWMDVFCTDQDSGDKPLSIMGDVYKCCKECTCMLDVDIPHFLTQPQDLWPEGSAKMINYHTFKLIECKWARRVWTLQEWMLPPEISYTKETHEKSLAIVNLCTVRRAISDVGVMFMLWNYGRIIRAESMIFRDYGGLSTVMSLMMTERECKDPVDYYYGIAGILDVPLTDGLPFHEVEREFITYFNGRSRINIIKTSSDQHRVYRHWKFEGEAKFIGNIIVKLIRN